MHRITLLCLFLLSTIDSSKIGPTESDSMKSIDPNESDLMKLIDSMKSIDSMKIDPSESDSMKSIDPNESDLMKLIDSMKSIDSMKFDPTASDSMKSIDSMKIDPSESDSMKSIDPNESDLMKLIDSMKSIDSMKIDPSESDSMKSIDPNGSDLMKFIDPNGSDSMKSIDPNGSDSMKSIDPMKSIVSSPVRGVGANDEAANDNVIVTNDGLMTADRPMDDQAMHSIGSSPILGVGTRVKDQPANDDKIIAGDGSIIDGSWMDGEAMQSLDPMKMQWIDQMKSSRINDEMATANQVSTNDDMIITNPMDDDAMQSIDKSPMDNNETMQSMQSGRTRDETVITRHTNENVAIRADRLLDDEAMQSIDLMKTHLFGPMNDEVTVTANHVATNNDLTITNDNPLDDDETNLNANYPDEEDLEENLAIYPEKDNDDDNYAERLLSHSQLNLMTTLDSIQFTVLTWIASVWKKIMSTNNNLPVSPDSPPLPNPLRVIRKKDPKKSTKPNILFVLVDDLGWGNVDFTEELFLIKRKKFYEKSLNVFDLRKRKREIEKSTSFISQLAKEGRVLTRHYVHCTCSPSRAALQTGRLPVHVQMTLMSPCQTGAGAPKDMTGIAERMRLANYSTHFVGKWDAGMATPRQIPVGRGYDTSLNYFSHGNWMWTEDVWVGSLINASRPPDCVLDRGCARDLWDSYKPAKKLNGTLYEEALFKNRLLEIIYRESANPAPLFLMYHPRVAHYPLQAPRKYQERFSFVPYPHRKVYTSMVAYLDDVLKSVVGALQDTNRWENTLMIFTSDNGGVVKTPARCVEARRGLACFNGEAGANNFPLRGGKYTNFEGGIRVASFISGGFVPKALRGRRVQGVMHIADWFSTFSALAGLPPAFVDPLAQKAGLPPIDSLDQRAMLLGDGPSARESILLNRAGLIKGNYKLLTGVQYGADWAGPLYPNISTFEKPVYDTTLVCKPGCLFDVEEDPFETHNLAQSKPELVKEMMEELNKQALTIWKSPRSTFDQNCLVMAKERWGGFLGPFRELPANMAKNRLGEYELTPADVR